MDSLTFLGPNQTVSSRLYKPDHDYIGLGWKVMEREYEAWGLVIPLLNHQGQNFHFFRSSYSAS